MKKFILAALVAVVSVSANAQFWAGGSVGFNTSKENSNPVKKWSVIWEKLLQLQIKKVA